MTPIDTWKVIVVDDEADSRQIVHAMLTQAGATVYCAADGAEFDKLMQTVEPTMILLDLAMPRPDGWVLLNKIRAMPGGANLPVVAITAHHSSRVAVDAERAGFAALIAKPLRTASFIEALQKVIDGH
ncbi:MAG: response regulator [Anaerolineae bacterium]|nr:response regulator [Anaerolineae bacterium]